MDGFDDAGVFFSDNFSETENSQSTTNQAVKKQLSEFIRTFQEGNFSYKYRDALKSNYLRRVFKVHKVPVVSSDVGLYFGFFKNNGRLCFFSCIQALKNKFYPFCSKRSF
jgi:hypothetical protein